MSNEIHAGLTGGLIGAAAVLVGVIGTEWAIRIRDRKGSVVEAAAEVALLLPKVIVPISRMWWTGRPSTRFDSEWSARHDQVNRLLLRIERDAQWPMRDAKAIRASARDTLARVGAMTHLWHERESAVTPVEFSDLLEGQPSHLTIKRERKLLSDMSEAYRAEFRKNRSADEP
jgi:hypothetical protein